MTPLAISSLLLISTGTWSTSLDGDAREELHSHELIGHYDADNHEAITPRGAAYVALLLATPLPVQQWVDPRGRIDDAQAQYLKPLIDRSASIAEQMGFEQTPKHRGELPDGFQFIPHDLKPGELPPNLGRDHNVEILDASGKRKVMLAGSVNWQNKGKKDSPVAYRGLGEADVGT